MIKKRKVLPAIALLCAAAAAGAQGGAPITAVVLYPGSATITRSGQVEAGATQLVIPNITAAFPTQTMRVDADPGIHIGQVETRDAGQVVSGNPEQAALEARIEALKDQAAALDAESQAAGIVKSYLERLGGDAAPADHPRAPADAKALAGIIDTLGHSASDVLARMQRLALQKRDLEKKIAALQRDLARLQGDSRDARTVVINLSASRGGSVRLSYQLPSAGWMPGYRAELDSRASAVQLVRTAQMSQKTGEDWKGVRLLLSTSQPRLSPQAPSPQPWLLSYESNEARERKFAGAPSKESLKLQMVMAPRAAAPAAAPPMEPQEEAYVPPSFQNEGSYETEFEISAPVTLPADGKEISLELSGQRLEVHQRLQIVPRVDRAATITAEAPRPAGVWLPGNLQLYRDGNYVGAMAWNPQASEKLALCFGRDELVRVTLDRLKGDQGNTGVFDRRNQRTIADVMTIHSRHAAPVDVLVLEAAPVSTAEEVKVTSRFDPEPGIRDWEQRRGVVGWEKTLRPDETARISVNYLIEYPKEGVVPGLGDYRER